MFATADIVLVPLLLSKQPGPFESWRPGDPGRSAGVSDTRMVAADLKLRCLLGPDLFVQHIP